MPTDASLECLTLRKSSNEEVYGKIILISKYSMRNLCANGQGAAKLRHSVDLAKKTCTGEVFIVCNSVVFNTNTNSTTPHNTKRKYL